MSDIYKDYLQHYGVGADANPPGRGSGRYPYGSGKNPRAYIEDMKFAFREKRVSALEKKADKAEAALVKAQENQAYKERIQTAKSRRAIAKEGVSRIKNAKRIEKENQLHLEELATIEEKKQAIIDSKSPVEFYKNIDLFSNQEIDEFVTRRNKENSIRTIVEAGNVSKGKQIVDKMSKAMDTASNIYNKSQNVAKIAGSVGEALGYEDSAFVNAMNKYTGKKTSDTLSSDPDELKDIVKELSKYSKKELDDLNSRLSVENKIKDAYNRQLKDIEKEEKKKKEENK